MTGNSLLGKPQKQFYSLNFSERKKFFVKKNTATQNRSKKSVHKNKLMEQENHIRLKNHKREKIITRQIIIIWHHVINFQILMLCVETMLCSENAC